MSSHRRGPARRATSQRSAPRFAAVALLVCCSVGVALGAHQLRVAGDQASSAEIDQAIDPATHAAGLGPDSTPSSPQLATIQPDAIQPDAIQPDAQRRDASPGAAGGVDKVGDVGDVGKSRQAHRHQPNRRHGRIKSPTAPPSTNSTPGGADPEGASSALPPNPAGATDHGTFAALANQARARVGCGSLSQSGPLTSAAHDHSVDMARHGVLTHDGSDGRDLAARAAQAGYPGGRLAENVAQGTTSAAQTFKAWMQSPGHRANLLNCSYTHYGLGRSGNYWTLDLGA